MDKDLEKKKSYGEQYEELLEKQGYLFVNDPPAELLAEKRYTYQDYLDWPEDERVELIDGKIYYMAAPSKRHQELLGRLHLSFGNYLHGKKCEVFVAPFDVRIDLLTGNDSVVQPDVLVVFDKDKLDEKGLNGTPDLVVEVLSTSNRSNDLIRKYNKYREVGVREYWIVDPEKEEIMINLLSADKSHYINKTYQKGDEIKVYILDKLIINVTDTFDGYQGKEIVEVEVARFEIAKNLLEMGMSIESVVAASRLTVEQIEELVMKG